MENSNKGQWTALWISFFSTVSIFLAYNGYSTQIPQIMEDLNINYSQIGMLASATALAAGILLPFGGIFTDKFGPKAITVIGLLITAIGFIIFGLSTSYAVMVFSRVIQGLGIPLLFVAPYSMAAKWFEQSNKIGISTGVMMTTDGVGGFIALYGLSYVLVAFGWGTGSLIGTIPIAVMCLIALLFLKNPPFVNDEIKNNKNNKSRERMTGRDYVSIILNRNVLVAASFLTGLWGSYALAVYWVPTILIENGWSESLAGFLGALYAGGGIVTAVVIGLMSDRVGKRKRFILITGMGMALTFIICAIAVMANSFVLLALMLPLSGMCGYGGMPICYALVADTVGVRKNATANGFVMGVGFLLGGFIYPLVVGYFKDASDSYFYGFIAAAVSLLLLNFLVALFAKDEKKSESYSYDVESSN